MMKQGLRAFSSVRIVGDADGIGKHVFIDGEEVSGVVSATVCYMVDHIPRVFLELNTTDVEVDDPEIEVVPYTNQTEYRKVYVDGKTD